MKTLTYEEMKITDVQLFNYADKRQTGENDFVTDYSYSANVVVNDTFMITVSGNTEECGSNIPCSDEAAWNSDKSQDFACENYDIDKIMEVLEIENNIGWLEDNATDVMNPENAQYI